MLEQRTHLPPALQLCYFQQSMYILLILSCVGVLACGPHDFFFFPFCSIVVLPHSPHIIMSIFFCFVFLYSSLPYRETERSPLFIVIIDKKRKDNRRPQSIFYLPQINNNNNKQTNKQTKKKHQRIGGPPTSPSAHFSLFFFVDLEIRCSSSRIEPIIYNGPLRLPVPDAEGKEGEKKAT
eukprot:gene847-484_t